MRRLLIGARLGGGLAMVAAALAVGMTVVQPGWAQHSQPNLSPDEQLAPSQMVQPMPGAVAEPGAPPPVSAPKPTPKPPAVHAAASPVPASVAKPARPAGIRTVVECSGPFAKDSGMLALAMAYDSRNMIFTQEKVQGTDVGVTVMFPKDPKRRLEVWWRNANRTGLYLIDITGKSMWVAPKGLRLGLTIEQIEKLNHKPFKMKGFDENGIATVADWDGGELAALPGGCKASVSMEAKNKTGAGELPAKDQYSSDDPALRALKPTVSEILIGY